jgi:hypothetical protein
LAFHPDNYGPQVAEILSLDDAGGGTRPMELFPGKCANETVRDGLLKTDAAELFPGARDPESALSGLFLYYSCLKEAHDLLHTFGSVDGAYWHGIMHRMEGDAYNADYWFRRISGHEMFPLLRREAAQPGYAPGAEWDPFAFTAFCGASARAEDDDLAKRVQLIEWPLLFDHCAGPARVTRVAAR